MLLHFFVSVCVCALVVCVGGRIAVWKRDCRVGKGSAVWEKDCHVGKGITMKECSFLTSGTSCGTLATSCDMLRQTGFTLGVCRFTDSSSASPEELLQEEERQVDDTANTPKK